MRENKNHNNSHLIPLQLFTGILNRESFSPVKNFEGLAPHNKPEIQFAKNTDMLSIPKVGTILQVHPKAKMNIINSREDLLTLTAKYPKIYEINLEHFIETLEFLDFEKLSMNYDAIRFTTLGICENRDFFDTL